MTGEPKGRERELDVARHYGVSDLAQRILAAVAAAGLDPERLRADDLAPIDEFHIGGRAATRDAVAKLALKPEHHVLDVGCGLGGATRYIAEEAGCRTTGVDLTPEYIDVARLLAARTGLADRIDYVAASALDMPLADASFDAALTLHVAMNIVDRAGLYREIARVLKPGALFCIYDVMEGTGALTYPVPWAEGPETSHLETPQAMATLLADAGFQVLESEDRTAMAMAFFRERMAAVAQAGGPPPLGLHLLMRDNGREKFANMQRNLESGAIVPVMMLARRAA